METSTTTSSTLAQEALQVVLVGGAGDDTLVGGPGDDSLSGGAGHDTLLGGDGNDILSGNAGNDFLIGGPGNDTYLFGRGDGQDRIEAYQDSPSDKLQFGSGISMADVDVSVDGGDLLLSLHGSTDSVRISGYFNLPPQDRLQIHFADGAVWDGAAIDRKLNFGNDTVYPLPTPMPGAGQTLDGGLGNDQVFGAMGDDILYGDAGNDILMGGPGADTYVFGRGDGQDRIEAYQDSASDKLQFGSGIGLADVDVSVDGGDLLLSLRGSTDSVRISGYFNLPSQDRLQVHFADGAVWDGAAIDRKLNFGNDTVYPLPTPMPGAGQTLDGGLGNDQIFGGPGDDILYGDAGNDILMGGPGNDTYLFGRGDGHDVVTEQGTTPIDLDTLQFAGDVTADQLWFSRIGNDLQVSIIGTTDTATVAGWYSGDAQHVDRFRTGDGQVLIESRVQQLVEAMAAFAPPPMGQTTLDTPYQPLMPVIAATWTP